MYQLRRLAGRHAAGLTHSTRSCQDLIDAENAYEHFKCVADDDSDLSSLLLGKFETFLLLPKVGVLRFDSLMGILQLAWKRTKIVKIINTSELVDNITNNSTIIIYDYRVVLT